MTFPDLHDSQEQMFRLSVRSVMLFASLPYYLAEEMHRDRMRCQLKGDQ